MRRIILSFGVLSLLAVLVFIWLIKAPIMSSYVTSKMGVPVSFRSISMWPSQTTLRHFVIMNPPGYGSDAAFKVNKTKIFYRFSHLNHNPSEIDEIILDGVYLNIELPTANPQENNWSDMGTRMHKKGNGHEVVIHKLILTNMTVETLGSGAQKLGIAGTRQFDRMEFEEIDSRDGFPTKELVAKIFEGAGLQKYLQYFLEAAGKIKDKLNPLKVFSENKSELRCQSSELVEGPPYPQNF